MSASKVIRLRRKGNKHFSVYEVVVCFSKSRRQGAFFERIGYINNQIGERVIFLNLMRLGFWLNKGVYLTSGLKKVLRKFL